MYIHILNIRLDEDSIDFLLTRACVCELPYLPNSDAHCIIIAHLCNIEYWASYS